MFKNFHSALNFVPSIASFLTLCVVFIATTVNNGMGIITRGRGNGSGQRAEYMPPLVGVVVDGPDSSRQRETLGMIVTIEWQRIMEVATLL